MSVTLPHLLSWISSLCKGEVVVRKGDSAEHFFVVIAGSCVVSRSTFTFVLHYFSPSHYAVGKVRVPVHDATEEQVVTVMKPGSVFGELGLVFGEGSFSFPSRIELSLPPSTGQRRAATVISAEPSLLLQARLGSIFGGHICMNRCLDRSLNPRVYWLITLAKFRIGSYSSS